MLVLSRKLSEKIVITAPCGTQITVCLVEIRHAKKCRIGVEAPRDWIVHRKEVADAIAKQKQGDAA